MRSSLPVSIAAHAAVFTALMYAPAVRMPEPSKSEYKQAIEGKEPKLIWYKFNKELPAVAAATPAKRPPKAESIAERQIVAAPRRAPKQKQIVWTPAPVLPEPAPAELPNVLAIKLPPLRKQFVTPPDIQKPAVQIELLPDAPIIAARTLKTFLPPDLHPKVRSKPAVPEAPVIAASTAKTFLPPVSPVAAPTPPMVTPDAPPDLNIAVVGLNPSEKLIPLPVAPSPGEFSGAQQIRKQGADSTGDISGIAIPDVSIRGKLLAQAMAAPTSIYTMREALRLAQPNMNLPPADPSPSSARLAAPRVSSAPDSRFNGRDVYMMAIQMPNLTSYSGSWLMWYADHAARKTGLSPVAPPEAHRKVDPKYVASAVADKVEGKIQLFCVIGKDGLVSSIEIVKGLDDRLNISAREALGKWQFAPATQNGEPVAVDVLVEIPFRLQALAP